jgi:hypothetical protein
MTLMKTTKLNESILFEISKTKWLNCTCFLMYQNVSIWLTYTLPL